jgi:hypothetical protein
VRGILGRLRVARVRRLEQRLDLVQGIAERHPGHPGWAHDVQRLQRRLAGAR